MATKGNYYTKEGLKKLKSELREMKTKGRANMARQISEARDKGDLRENAEYNAAKEAQGLLELRISKLESLIASARVVDVSKMDRSRATVLSKVEVRGEKGVTMDYVLVAEEEADVKAKKISVSSPLGKALIGKRVGDKVEVKTPGGVRHFEILNISLEAP